MRAPLSGGSYHQGLRESLCLVNFRLVSSGLGSLPGGGGIQ